MEEAGASSEVETSSKSEEEITEGNAGEAEAPGRMPTMPTKMPAPNLLNDEDPRRGNIFIGPRSDHSLPMSVTD